MHSTFDHRDGNDLFYGISYLLDASCLCVASLDSWLWCNQRKVHNLSNMFGNEHVQGKPSFFHLNPKTFCTFKHFWPLSMHLHVSTKWMQSMLMFLTTFLKSPKMHSHKYCSMLDYVCVCLKFQKYSYFLRLWTY